MNALIELMSGKTENDIRWTASYLRKHGIPVKIRKDRVGDADAQKAFGDLFILFVPQGAVDQAEDLLYG